jgi:hypothetical protein
MQTISGIALALVAGVVGWIVAEFFGKPLRRGLALIEETRKDIIRYGNVSGSTYQRGPAGHLRDVQLSHLAVDRLRTAQEAYRDLGAKLQAFAKTEPIATWVLKRCGLHVYEAGVVLIGLSNSIHEYGSRRADFF